MADKLLNIGFMALSKQDRDFYEEKMSWKALGYLFIWTTVVGTVGWPLLLYIQDASAGLTGRWTLNIALEWASIGFMLGTVVAVFVYLGFKFFLAMGWLPSRR